MSVRHESREGIMAGAGAGIIVAQLGLTTGGSIGAETALKLEDCPAEDCPAEDCPAEDCPAEDCPAVVDRLAAAALAVKPDAIILVHGGPLATPEDAAFVRRALPSATAATAPPPWSACRPKPRCQSRPAPSRASREAEPQGAPP